MAIRLKKPAVWQFCLSLYVKGLDKGRQLEVQSSKPAIVSSIAIQFLAMSLCTGPTLAKLCGGQVIRNLVIPSAFEFFTIKLVVYSMDFGSIKSGLVKFIILCSTLFYKLSNKLTIMCEHISICGLYKHMNVFIKIYLPSHHQIRVFRW